MQATRLWRLACLLVLGSAALASCGKDEATTHPNTPQGGANGGASAGTRATPVAGDDSGPLGNGGASGGSTTTGGSTTGGSSTNVGGDGTAGAHANNGTMGDAGAGGVLGAGGSGANSPPGEQLVLCTRITSKVPHADAQARAFAKAVFGDCRIKWVVPLGPNLDEYRQQLVVWNLEFWGCQGKPVSDFGLVYGMPALSAGDADLLVELYLATVDAELQLSSEEKSVMKAALDRLAKPLISSPSADPSHSSCVDESGGTAGHGGAP